MKTRVLSLILTFALLLPCLFSCDGADGTPSFGGTSSGKTGQNSGDAEPAETEPDYSWFEMLEQTGKFEVVR